MNRKKDISVGCAALLALLAGAPAWAQSGNGVSSVPNVFDGNNTTSASVATNASACPTGWTKVSNTCTIQIGGKSYTMQGWVQAAFLSYPDGTDEHCGWDIALRHSRAGAAAASTQLFWSDDQGATWHYRTAVSAPGTATTWYDTIGTHPTSELWIVAGRKYESLVLWPATLYWYELAAESFSAACGF